jgi:hypothetical protein
MAAFETDLPDVHSCKLLQPYIPNGKFYKDAMVSYREEGAEEVRRVSTGVELSESSII